MNSKRKALAEALRNAAESFAREAYDLAELVERAEEEYRGTGANPPPWPLQASHRGPSEPVRTAEADTMTPDEYRSALEKLGLTAEQAANALGVARSTAFKYAREGPIPGSVVKLLNLYLRHRVLLPP